MVSKAARRIFPARERQIAASICRLFRPPQHSWRWGLWRWVLWVCIFRSSAWKVICGAKTGLRRLAQDRPAYYQRGASAARRGRSCPERRSSRARRRPRGASDNCRRRISLQRFLRTNVPRTSAPWIGSIGSRRRRLRVPRLRPGSSVIIAPPRKQEQTASTAQHRQALDEERARSAALASELATAQREIETQAAQLRKASEETTQLKQAEAAKSTQSLEQERQKTAALAQEAAAARQELTASTAQHRQALDEERARGAALASELATAQREIETQAAQLRKASEETEQLKQAEAAKSAQSLEQERQKTAALAQEAAAARQELTTSTANIVKRSTRNAHAVPHWRANSRRRSAKSRRRRRNCARRARKRRSSSRRKPRRAHNRSNRSGRKRPPSRRRPRPRDKS